ncbi:MAG: DHA2 family efflux MFS transporter permease subunit [Chloroflexi bacterium]|nr:DHA2 family efflux MFS transporter permease subunit [Chloroflexota bacterium]
MGVVLAYLLGLATLMLSIGRLADIRGKKQIYATGFVIFTIGSVLCGLSPNIYWLIFFRIVQSVGAAMVLALGTAIVTEAFPLTERGKALGFAGSVISIGIVLGPTLGGLLIDALSWHWIFFVNLPVGILGTWMVLRFVPDIKPAGGQRFDFAGAITLFFSLVAFLFTLTLGQEWGFTDLRILLLFLAGIVLLVVFLGIERRTAQPMIDLELFRNSLFSINLFTGFLAFIAIAGTVLLLPFYLENVLGYGPRTVGILLAIVPIGLGVLAPISGLLSDRFGTRPISIMGLLVLLLGYYLMSTLTTTTSAVGYLLLNLPLGLGMGIFQSPNNSAVMGAAPRERLGVASGMLALTRTLGQTTGVAVMGAIWAARVVAYAGGNVPGGATAAPAASQVAGLHDTFLGITGLIAIASVAAIWGLTQARRRRIERAA